MRGSLAVRRLGLGLSLTFISLNLTACLNGSMNWGQSTRGVDGSVGGSAGRDGSSGSGGGIGPENGGLGGTVAGDLSISAISPTEGSWRGGVPLTITGEGFNPTGMTVTVGGVNCWDVNYVSSTTLTCVTPKLAAGFLPHDVTVSDGTDTVSLRRSFTPLTFIYVTQRVSGTIKIFQLRAGGSLTPLASFTGFGDPSEVEINPRTNAIHVVERNSVSIRSLGVNPATGALTALDSKGTVGDEISGFAVHPAGIHIHTAQATSARIGWLQTDVILGNLLNPFGRGLFNSELVPTEPLSYRPYDVTFGLTGIILSTNDGSGKIIKADYNSGTFATPVEYQAVPGNPSIEPSRLASTFTHLYTGSPNSNHLMAYGGLGEAVMTPLAGSPYAVASPVTDIALAPSATMVYILSESGMVSHIEVGAGGVPDPASAGSGALITMLSPGRRIAVDESGLFLAVTTGSNAFENTYDDGLYLVPLVGGVPGVHTKYSLDTDSDPHGVVFY